MKRYVILCCCMISTVIFAHTQPSTNKSPWAGTSAKFGAVINTGNTNTSQYNAGGLLDYTRHRWNNVTIANWQFGRSEGETNQEKYFAQDEVTYGLNDLSTKYLFLLTSLNVDIFSPYKYQFLFATGYGFYFWKSDHSSLRFQLGPGYRRDKVDGTNEIHDQIVATTRTTFKWQITKNTNFSQIVQYDLGSEYNYLKTVSKFSNKITGHIAIQISYVLENYSKIPAGSNNTKNTDATTNIAVVYNF